MSTSGRLIITKVVLENFKSYAGVIVIGPFHICFTSVVGPNGSGKSNLLESLLFAFGKRAGKMRLKRISELIHKSKFFPGLKYAKVEVHFTNIDENSSIVEGSEFILSRVVLLNNTSVYKVNNIDSSYENVTNLLKSRGIDLEHNRFLILQGEVEQIAMMKPRGADENKGGLLEYLEEIIGSDVYISEIQAFEHALEEISEELVSKKVYLQEATKAVEDLAEPMKEAKVYLKQHQQLFQLKNIKFQVFQQRIIGITEELHKDQEKLVLQIRELEEKYSQKRTAHADVLNEYDRKFTELKVLQKKELVIQAQITDLFKSDAELGEAIHQYSSKAKALKSEMEIEQKRLEDSEKYAVEIEQKIPGIHAHYTELKNEREKVEKKFEKISLDVMAKNAKFVLKKEGIEKDLAPLKRELGKLKNDVDANMKKIQMSEQDLNGQLGETKRLESEYLKVETEISKQSENELKVMEKFSDVNKAISIIISELHFLESESMDLSKSINEKKRVLNDIEIEEKGKEGASRLIREILSAKQQGLLKGVIGRLGDLAVIDPQFDIAISSASSMFDNIVTETVKNAEDLLSFVREKQLGKINVIVLEKVQDFNYQNFTTPDPRALRLFDLLKITDKRVQKAFYLALKDALVTDSLEIARVIAFELGKRWKVVTKNGEVINPSGEMMGFSRPHQGKVQLASKRPHSENFSKEELQTFLSQITGKLEATNQELRTCERKLISEQQNKNHLENQLRLISSEIEGNKEKLLEIQKRLRSLQGRVNEFTDEEILGFHELVKKNESAMEKLEKIMKIRTDEIAKIDRVIEEQGGEEFMDLKKQKKYLIENEEKVDLEQIKEAKKLCQFHKDAERYKLRLEKIHEEIEQVALQLAAGKEKKIKLLEAAEEKASEIKTVSLKVHEKSKEISDLDIIKDSIKAEFFSISSSRDSLKEKKNEISKKIQQSDGESQKVLEKIINNRQDYFKQNFEILLEDTPEIVHEDKKNNISDSFSYNINTDFSTEDLENFENIFGQLTAKESEISEILSNASPNLFVLKDYEAKKRDKLLKETQFTQVKDLETQKKKRYLELKNNRLNDFTKGFHEISSQLRRMYRKITRGGDAELEFADTTDPFSEGVIFTVRPPHKSWKKMANLSGGEKTLSSLALVFALHHYKPNALYVMDEVDAALDFQNVGVIANYIKARTKNAQFIIVSLRYQMFELADQLVGVYKTADVSQCITISPCVYVNSDTDNAIVKQTVNNINL